jgi:hypothetical protein
MRHPPRLCLCLGLALTLTGCAKTPPPVTEAEGVVLLDGVPLPNARVEFVPQLSDFGAEMNSSGVTDEKGRFRLTCNDKEQPGAVVGKHRVLVTDPPMPREFRGQSEKAQAAATAYLQGLKNRPIPEAYATVGRTPLEVEVTTEQKSYTLNLTRKP